MTRQKLFRSFQIKKNFQNLTIKGPVVVLARGGFEKERGTVFPGSFRRI